MVKIAIEARESSIEQIADEFDPISQSSDSLILDESIQDVVYFVDDNEIPTSEWTIDIQDNDGS